MQKSNQLTFSLLNSNGAQSQLLPGQHETSTGAPITTRAPNRNRGVNLALSPIENDLLGMNIKHGGEFAYNIHELPANDGKSLNLLAYFNQNKT